MDQIDDKSQEPHTKFGNQQKYFKNISSEFWKLEFFNKKIQTN